MQQTDHENSSSGISPGSNPASPCRAGQRQDNTGSLSLLGGGRLPTPKHGPEPGLLETFANCAPERPYIISISYPEFTSLCPVTGQPDFGNIIVDYVPDASCVESKSFKLYMFAFRNHQSFMETITNTVLDHLVQVLDPCWCRVRGLFVPRGGTRINVFAEHFKALPAGRAALVKNAVDAWRLQAGCA